MKSFNQPVTSNGKLNSLAVTFCLFAALMSACDSSDSKPAGTAPTSADDIDVAMPVNDEPDPPQTVPAGNDDDSPDTGGAPELPDTTEAVSMQLPILPGYELAALPDTPLSAAPDAQSEPIELPGTISTISEFSLLRDPYSTRDIIDTTQQLTDADFAAGPLPAIILTPESVDPDSNGPPYFVNLNDVEAVVGEMLVLRIKPRDPDGDVPGMFTESLPETAQFIDNFDGSKSLHWRPLQPDEGIHEFTVTATDPAEPFYRTERTVRIRVSMPADESTIVNLPPGINKIRKTMARVNDPVVAYIKVTDPNGTIPSLEIVNGPPGATTTPHHSEPDFTILSFTPETAGEISIEVLARDAIDPELTAQATFVIDVKEAASFNRPGARLRELASARDFMIGYAATRNFYEFPDGALYADIAGEEFNIVTSENAMKWDLLNPLPGKYRWAAADNLVRFAKSRDQLVHGHTLVWYTNLPGWIKRSALHERETHMREFIDRVLQRYADDVPIWDVVNESLEDDGSLRNSIWHEAMGPSYIDIAFRQARQSAPDAILLYNEYDVAYAGPKSSAMVDLMQTLKDAGTPIDGVGFQLHLFADFDRFEEVAETFQKIANLDLDIYVTELDVSMRSEHSLDQQAHVFEQILSACLNQPRCKAFQSWGFTDMYSWRSDYQPLMFDEQYRIKPAYTALQERLREN